MSAEPVIRAMHSEEKQQLMDLWLEVWPGEQNAAYFRRYFYGDVEWLPYYTQVAEIDGRIVSSVHICKRQVWCSGALLTMGGIANVATLEQYRGKGLNAQCMAKAIHMMEADAMDFSLLFTGIPAYYQKYGYCSLSRGRIVFPCSAVRGSLALQNAQDSGIFVRPAAAQHMPSVRQLYREFNLGRSITVDRWDAYWRDWMHIDPSNPPSELIVAVTAEGSVCGYVLTGTFSSAVPYQSSDRGVRVLEIAWDTRLGETDQITAAAALLAGAAQSIGAGNLNLILDCALTPEVKSACTRLAEEQEPGTDPLTFTEGGAAMVKLLRPEHLMKSLCILWSERWFQAGRPTGTIEVAFDDLTLTMDARGPMLNITQEYGAPGALKLTQAQFVSLLFGAGADSLPVAEQDQNSLLASLFTQGGTVFYGKDGF